MLAATTFTLATATALAEHHSQLSLSLCDPRENSFTLKINNAYFPLPVGRQWILVGDDSGQLTGLRITVLPDKEKFVFRGKTVTTRVVDEFEWGDANGNGVVDAGEPVNEDSRNFFAQTSAGTVCYFGEATVDSSGSTAGSWRADAPGNAPGIFMPAKPKPGMKFQQEYAPGIAEDEATIVGTGSVTVPYGTFTQTIRVREDDPLDGSKEYKNYAKNVGIIVDDTLTLRSFSP